jgi:hypothetical protein
MVALEIQNKKGEDISDKISIIIDREAKCNKARDALQSELEDAADFVIHLEEKVYKANKTALVVMKQLKESKA